MRAVSAHSLSLSHSLAQTHMVWRVWMSRLASSKHSAKNFSYYLLPRHCHFTLKLIFLLTNFYRGILMAFKNRNLYHIMPNMILLFPEMLVCDKKVALSKHGVCECVTVTHMHAWRKQVNWTERWCALLAPRTHVHMYTCIFIHFTCAKVISKSEFTSKTISPRGDAHSLIHSVAFACLYATPRFQFHVNMLLLLLLITMPTTKAIIIFLALRELLWRN